MKFPISFLFLLLVLNPLAFAQNNDSLFSRLQAISSNGIDFFNVDGIEITSETLPVEFSKKNILRKFRSYELKENELTYSDSTLAFPNYYVLKTIEMCPAVKQYVSYYLIGNGTKKLTGITFSASNKNDPAFEKEFIRLILNNLIPKNIYTPLQIDSINFAGRKIKLGSVCQWRGINNVQCPNYGQMNWSVHKNLVDASQCANDQFYITQAKKFGKVVSEEMVDVIFEGTEIKAKKVIYDFTGITAVITTMNGANRLIIYYVASPVRQFFVSCVMSFWTIDYTNENGLPPLLGEVMQLKK